MSDDLVETATSGASEASTSPEKENVVANEKDGGGDSGDNEKGAELQVPGDEGKSNDKGSDVVPESNDDRIVSEGNEEEEKDEKEEEMEDDRTSKAMELNVAFEALEMMRKVNLQVEFGESINPCQCVTCKREELKQPTVRRFGQRFRRPAAATPCLACQTSVCNRHRSKDFGRENITICSECSHLLSPEAIVDSLVQAEDKRQKKNYLLEVYDRTLLILKYSMQYIEEVAQALENNTRRNNKIGFGSSAAGVVSGVMGVTAAVTIFTPVGPPLLLASVLFGGSATAAAAGSEAVNYRCEPNKMADKIIALHAITTAISQMHELEKSEDGSSEEGTDDDAITADEKPVASNASSTKTASSRYLHITRASMNALKPLTAGALSAISIVTEARQMQVTLTKIRAGNPCDKAETLREIKPEVEKLPQTTDVAKQLDDILSRPIEVAKRVTAKAKLTEDLTEEVQPEEKENSSQ